MTTYPAPGQTKFDSALPHDEARKIAEAHYDYVEVLALGETYHSIRCNGEWKAMVGLIGGVPHILHKTPSGGRELQIA